MKEAWKKFVLFFVFVLGTDWSFAAEESSTHQYILVNQRPAISGKLELPREAFLEIKNTFPEKPVARIRVGVGFIFSYFRASNDDVLLASLRRVLELSEETARPFTSNSMAKTGGMPDPICGTGGTHICPVTIRRIAKMWNGSAGVLVTR